MTPATLDVRHDDYGAAARLASSVRLHLTAAPSAPIVVCIGSDRSTGDAFGPLVGTFLVERGFEEGTVVWGTVRHPVHASNLARTKAVLPRRPCLAVDAALGRQTSVGLLTVAAGPLTPGAGVDKKLAPLGDLHITGIVNLSGFMEYFVLQTTRLGLVMAMAKVAADGIAEALGAAAESEVAAGAGE